MKRIVMFFVWNILMGTVVFLPTFLVGTEVQVLLRSRSGDGQFLSIVGDQLFMFAALLIPVIEASIIFGVLSLLLPSPWRRRRGLASVLLSLALVVFFASIGATILHSGLLIIFFAFFPASVVVAVLYGLVARIEPDL